MRADHPAIVVGQEAQTTDGVVQTAIVFVAHNAAVGVAPAMRSPMNCHCPGLRTPFGHLRRAECHRRTSQERRTRRLAVPGLTPKRHTATERPKTNAKSNVAGTVSSPNRA